MRYAWDLQEQYLREANLDRGIRGQLARWMLLRMRRWDLRSASRVDEFIANSHYIAQRIWRAYRRHSAVIYPPVDVDAFTPEGSRGDFYVTASRLVPYKRIDLIVEAFAAMPQRRLLVIGGGPEEHRVRAKAEGAPNVELLGQQPFEVLRDRLRGARAFVFAAEEDFGIAPLEAQACGTPVVAYGSGGAIETIRPLGESQPTGVFFEEQSVSAVVQAVKRFEREGHTIRPDACRENALRFAPHRFRRELAQYVEAAIQRRSGRLVHSGSAAGSGWSNNRRD